MSESSQGFGEYGAFTVAVGGDPRLADTVRELTRKTAEMAGCSHADAAGLADATCAVASAIAGDLNLAYRPTASALEVEVRPARRPGSGTPLRAALARGDAFARVKTLVPAAELHGTGADECCFLTCPRGAADPA